MRGREFESFERGSGRKPWGYVWGGESSAANRERGQSAGVAQRPMGGGLTAIAFGDEFESSR